MSGRCCGKKLSAAVWLAAVGLLSGSIISCGKKFDDAARVSAAISNLRSGAVIRAIETASQDPGVEPSQTVQPELQNRLVADPCEHVTISEQDDRSSLLGLMSCVRGFFEKAKRLGNEFTEFQIFTKVNGKAELRQSFSDSELEHLAELAQARKQALREAEAQTLAALRPRTALLQRAASELGRYSGLLEYLNTIDEGRSDELYERLSELFKFTSVQIPRDSKVFPKELLRPYALEALIPDSGREFLELRGGRENPFQKARDADRALGGSRERVGETLSLYRKWRDQDNPELPQISKPDEQAAQVSFIDSGLDFVKFPELGVFLGSSYDFADDDVNPWLPGFRWDFAHGAGTVATLLTLISAQNPELLAERKIDVSVWKTLSLRQVLSGREGDHPAWENRKAESSAIISYGAKDLAMKAEKLRVLSVSEGFRLVPYLKEQRRDFIKALPWLWVMAAGNAGVELENALIPSCLNDLGADRRDDGKIICVGALIREQEIVKIAGYSNFGERVDLYTFDSYSGLCPNGTSCATPAITAAAAVLAAKFPQLTAEQIKQAILSAAELRELEVDVPAHYGPAPLREVRVFDTLTALPRAIEKAAAMSQNNAD